MIKPSHGEPIERSVTKTALPKPKLSLAALRKAVTAITPNKGGRPKKAHALSGADKQRAYRERKKASG